MSPRERLLLMIAGRGGMTLAGNKEYFAVLRFQQNRWVLEDGDPLTGESEFAEVSPEYAGDRIMERCRYLFEMFGPQDSAKPTDGDILAFMSDWPTST